MRLGARSELSYKYGYVIVYEYTGIYEYGTRIYRNYIVAIYTVQLYIH